MIITKGKMNSYIAKITASLIVFNLVCPVLSTQAIAKKDIIYYSKPIANGVMYTDKEIYNSQYKIKQRVRIVTANLNNNYAGVIFSKAKDKAKKAEVLTKQIVRETFKGNEVVAGINADMFNMKTGFSTGAQVKDGAIIAGFNSRKEESVYPVVGIDYNNKAFIDYIKMSASLTVEGKDSNVIGDSGNTIDIDNVNRESYANSLILTTNQVNELSTIDFNNFSQNGALTVIKGINEPIKLGKEYEGTVENLGVGLKSIEIPGDTIVLASHGIKAEWIKEHVKVGDKIKFKVSFNKNNIKELLGAYTYLIKKGRVLQNEEMIKNGANPSMVKSRKARTAVGITSDNKFISVAADVGSSSYSSGATYYDMGQLLKKMGAIDAVSMDGGGSTEMIVRLQGETKTTVVNKPSDGQERALTNGILFINKSPKNNQPGIMEMDKEVYLYKNTSYKFTIKGVDKNYNPADFSNASIAWSSAKNIGSIDNKGVLISGKVKASGIVSAVIGKVKCTSKVNVLDKISRLYLSNGSLIQAGVGEKKQLYLRAEASNKQPLIISNSAASWGLLGNIGKIDKNGLLTITSKSGSGIVTVSAGGQKTSIKVVLKGEDKIIDDFEHNDNARYQVTGYAEGKGSITNEKAKSGKYSYKLSYEYNDTWIQMIEGSLDIDPMYVDYCNNDITDKYTSYSRPKKLGMWVYGDGAAPSINAEISDNYGTKKTLNLVPKVDWTGWKYIDCDIPTDMSAPIYLEKIFIMESDKSYRHKGDIYIDDIKFVYSECEDYKEPKVTEFYPDGTVYSKNPNITLNLSDELSGVNTKSIKTKLDGTDINNQYDNATGALKCKTNDLKEGTHIFELQATDCAGNPLNPSFKKTFSVSLKKDDAAPIVNEFLPLNNSYVKTNMPRISFNIKDLQSGINADDISVELDGKKLKVYYDERSGFGYTIPESELSNGKHTISLSAKDRVGNGIATLNNSFTIKSIQGPKDSNNFCLSFISDTHDSPLTSDFFRAISKDKSELVISNGDLIDEDKENEWSYTLKQVSDINKSILYCPGNHERTSGNINNFIKYNGIPVYSLDYGNTILISLDSSKNQSISESDPTQFDYLKRILNMNNKKNIFIFTHTPVMDTLGLNLGMNKADVTKLQSILGAYKNDHKNVNINVVSGHSHVNQEWSSYGINYYIDGNGSMKEYTSPEKGGFLSYTIFNISNSSIKRCVEPLVNNISILDNAMQPQNRLVVPEGTIKQLNVYGDFSLKNSNYILAFKGIKNIDVKWESDNPDVVSVSQDGIIKVKGIGTANIRASILNTTCEIKVSSVSRGNFNPCGIRIVQGNSSIISGGKLSLNVAAFDLYGTGYSIPNSDINWSASSDIGKFENGKFVANTISSESIEGEICATYKGFNSKIKVIIRKK